MNLNTFKASALCVGILASAAGFAHGETAYALVNLTSGQEIITFDTSDPSTFLNQRNLSPAGNDALLGIDYFGGILYAIGGGGNLYTINPDLGTMTAPINFAGPLLGAYWGVDATAGGIHIVSAADVNMMVSYAGALTTLPNLTPGGQVVTTIASYANTLYGIGRPIAINPGTLWSISDVSDGTGAMTAIAALSRVSSRINGFDISEYSGNLGYGYFASQPGSGSGVSQLFTVNLANGGVNVLGQFDFEGGEVVSGLAVVPEPSTTMLALAGGLGLLGLIRRRK